MDVLAGSVTWMYRYDRFSVVGEVAERSKALDWNSSNISTGVRGFESHPLRHTIQNLEWTEPGVTRRSARQFQQEGGQRPKGGPQGEARSGE